MNHLTADELIDAMEGMLDAARRSHLDECEQCRQELANLSSVLREAQAVEVPEPSPLFWQHFSQRVRAAVDAEALPAAGWLRWPVFVPLGAMALVLFALATSLPGRIDSTVPSTELAGSGASSDVALANDRWVMVADMVGDMDWETASAAGLVVKPGAAEQAVQELSAEEQQELTRLLKAELLRAKS
jgi:hypothetical protein